MTRFAHYLEFILDANFQFLMLHYHIILFSATWPLTNFGSS